MVFVEKEQVNATAPQRAEHSSFLRRRRKSQDIYRYSRYDSPLLKRKRKRKGGTSTYWGNNKKR